MATKQSVAASSASITWVAAADFKNHVVGNPLLDWLEMYGEQNGYRASEPSFSTDFGEYIFEQFNHFISHLRNYISDTLGYPIHVIHMSNRGSFVRSALDDTISAMKAQEVIIHKGHLGDEDVKVFDTIDFLVRNDVMQQIFPDTVAHITQGATPSELPTGSEHYVTLRARFSMLGLNASGYLSNAGTNMATKVRLLAANQALGKMQGFYPSHGFVVGRGWKQTKRGVDLKGHNSMEIVAPVELYAGSPTPLLAQNASQATEWLRDLKHNGGSWVAEPSPSVPELRPNYKAENNVWDDVVTLLVAATEDLTKLYYVSPKKRDAANQKGLCRYSDPTLSVDDLDVTSGKASIALKRMLEVLHSDTHVVLPHKIQNNRSEWRDKKGLEFYIDFETTSDLNDNFAAFPSKVDMGTMIFMIGCGHVEDGEWVCQQFTAEELSKAEEASILYEWLEYMEKTQQLLGSSDPYRLIHWSAHEKTTLKASIAELADDSTAAKVEDLVWLDLLKDVFLAEPVAVKGCFAFGLKAIVAALHEHGLIEVEWPSSIVTDGKKAMVAAWRANHAVISGAEKRLMDVPLMQDVEVYNEIDCFAMREIHEYLRTHH